MVYLYYSGEAIKQNSWNKVQLCDHEQQDPECRHIVSFKVMTYSKGTINIETKGNEDALTHNHLHSSYKNHNISQ